MSVFFNVPSIGNSTGKQKGPTCWFYAAKMIRKFHDAYDKTDHASRIRILSVIRKVITFMDQDIKVSPEMYSKHSPGDQGLKAFNDLSGIAKLPYSNVSDPFGLMLKVGFVRFGEAQQRARGTSVMAAAAAAATVAASTPVPAVNLTVDGPDPLLQGTSSPVPQGPPTSTEMEEAFHLMYQWGRQASPFSRQFILREWRFEPISKNEIMDCLTSPEHLERLLALRGPIWAGGFFEPQELLHPGPGDSVPIEHSGSEAKWTARFKLLEGLDRTHAIAVLGVSTKLPIVAYRDPLMSETVFTLPFDQFRNAILRNLKDDAISLMYYDCPRCSREGADSCRMRQEKRLKMTSAVYG